MGYDATILAEPGLVSYWKLNESSGAAAADSQDSNPGAYAGGYTLGRAAPGALMGGAVLFDGSTGYVTVPTAANLHPTTALSLEAWVNLTALPAAFKTVAGTGYSSNVAPFVDYALGVTNANQLNAGLAVGPTQTPLNGPVPDAGKWYYMALTYDGATMRFYVNGAEVANTPLTGAVHNSGQAFQIGRYLRGASVGENFNGAVSSVALYNASLSAARVLAHWNAAGAPKARVSQAGVLVAAGGTPAARVSQAGVLVIGDWREHARVSQAGLLVAAGGAPAARVSQAGLLAVADMPPAPAGSAIILAHL